MSFKIGDKVRVKPLDQINKTIKNSPGWINPMKKCIGKKATVIKAKIGTEKYLLEIETETQKWWIHENWATPVPNINLYL